MKKSSPNGTSARVSALAACLLVWSAAPTDVAARESSYEWSNVPRVVAIGDVHGAYDKFVAVLKSVGLLPDETAMAVLDDEESTKKSQRRCRRREEIHRGSAVLVMAQK